MATTTNRKYVADYGPLEEYYNEIQRTDHENHFTSAQYADPKKYCYGINGEPCPFSPTPVQDPFLQLSNRVKIVSEFVKVTIAADHQKSRQSQFTYSR